MKCKICEKEFVKITNKKYCSRACIKQSIINEFNKAKNKKCIYCNNIFIGKGKESLCSECKLFKTKNKKYKKRQVSILCPKCQSIIKIVIKNNTKNNKTKISNQLCISCKEYSKKQRSYRMQCDNPMFNINSIIKMSFTLTGILRDHSFFVEKRTRKKETKEEMRQRMIQNNPMKIKEIKERVSKTLKLKYLNNEIQKRIGINHWLWKGNRKRSFILRSRIYHLWALPIKQKQSFTCQDCGKKGYVEVHHLSKTFKQTLDECLSELKFPNLDTLSDLEFKQISDLFIEKHKNIVGITYCIDCHKKNDPQRR